MGGKNKQCEAKILFCLMISSFYLTHLLHFVNALLTLPEPKKIVILSVSERVFPTEIPFT